VLEGKGMNNKRVTFASTDDELIEELGRDKLLDSLRQMLLIRNFEIRAEAAYLQGKVGGFFHSYIGQEAIQTSLLTAIGKENWYITSYRCHALALLLGEDPNSLMAELYGRATGNAKGRGGSMHFFSDRLLGGYGIVGGQIPIATGAAFTIKYRENKKEIAVCFLGDGAVAQGAFHEAINLAALWDLPCLYIIENNKWGMGTPVEKAVSVKQIAELKAPGYGIHGYTIDGMDFFRCYSAFSAIQKQMLLDSRPVLVEVLTSRFKGHSISDPGLYRTKENLKSEMENDPIIRLEKVLESKGIIDAESFKKMDREQKEIALAAMKYADESPWPDPATLEQDVFAP
jgi:pyruvate dehydrogenase E1 component alpha subunit